MFYEQKDAHWGSVGKQGWELSRKASWGRVLCPTGTLVVYKTPLNMMGVDIPPLIRDKPKKIGT